MTEKAQYHQLGKSGLRVSVPILGCMSFGSSKWSTWTIDEDEAFPLLEAAWDAGINTFDTANAYSNGESERIIGKFIVQKKIPRENLVIMTKLGMLVHRDVGTFAVTQPHLAETRDYVNNGGLSRAAIFNAVEASLARLNTTYIDVLQIHVPDATTPLEETLKALHDLVTAGKVRYIGACNLRTWLFAEMNRVAEINGWTKFSCIQVEHSLLYRAEEPEMLEYCNFKGIGVISYAPLMDGHLARPAGSSTPRTQWADGTPFGKTRRPCDEEIIRRVEKIANQRGWKMAQVALAWSSTKVSSPIVGSNTPEKVKGCIISGKSLNEAEINSLEEPYEHQPRRPWL